MFHDPEHESGQVLLGQTQPGGCNQEAWQDLHGVLKLQEVVEDLAFAEHAKS